MKKNIQFLLFLILLFPTMLFSQNDKKVLMIGIDGCRPDALQIANTPNIDELIANGIFAPDALNDDITVSGPGWSAILCGVWSDKHGVVDNYFAERNYEEYPVFFKHLKDFDENFDLAAICHWPPINGFIIQDFADFKLNVFSDEDVEIEAVNYISENKTDVMFLHFDDCDHYGHINGFSPDVPEYMAQIEKVDGHIGAIMQAIKDRPTYENEDWLVLISTDHGGIGTSHGGDTMEEQNVFIIASGDNIPTSVIEKDSTMVGNMYFYNYDESGRITDLVPTALRHLCVPIADAWQLDGVSLISECDNVGIENEYFSEANLQIFPNPAHTILNLSLKNATFHQKINLEIYGFLGQKIYEQSILQKDTQIDVSHLQAGIYYAVLKSENKVYIMQKFIKITNR